MKSVDACGRGSLTRIDPETGNVTIIPVRCKSWKCEHCRGKKKYDWTKRIMAGKPTRWLTITLPARVTGNTSAQFAQLKAGFALVVRLIRKRFQEFEYVAIFELQSRGAPHVHVVFRGRFIPQKWLSLVCQRNNLGYICDIRAIKNQGQAISYCTKYLTKAAGTDLNIPRYTRLVCASRNYSPEQSVDDAPIKDEVSEWTFSPESVPERARWFIAYEGAAIVSESTTGAVVLQPVMAFYAMREKRLKLEAVQEQFDSEHGDAWEPENLEQTG